MGWAMRSVTEPTSQPSTALCFCAGRGIHTRTVPGGVGKCGNKGGGEEKKKDQVAEPLFLKVT